MLRLFCILPLAGFLIGCSTGEDEAPGMAAGTLTGTAFYPERIAMPQGAYLAIVLVDVGDEAEVVLARHVLDDVGNPPYEFRIDYDEAGIDPDGDHELWLTLHLPDGRERFVAERPVDLSQSRLDQIRLVAVESRQMPAAGTRQSYQCVDILMEANFGDDSVRLNLPWQDVTLGQVEAARGTRYSDDAVEFRLMRGDKAVLTLPDREPVECRPSDRRSPWVWAREGGVTFRAIGNEPGWALEVIGGDQPALRLSLDYGTRELDFGNVTVLADDQGYIAESPGNHAEIRLFHEPCHDTMIGWEFPIRVEMTLNELELTACGRFL